MSPQTIGNYQIIGELGRGAMGVVYHAHDPGIGRPVAIKVIRVESDTSAEEGARLRQRLVREASAAGNLSHPGIVTVYQLGDDGHNVFIVMEYVAGVSLDRMLANRAPLDPRQVLEILQQVAEALDYAHQAGVVHRDVKPANILVRGDGRVKIADFGIAKMLQGATQTLTATGVSLGSPAYMSPEQVRGDNLDRRSDQFSLASMAYQMLSGRMPFTADTAHALMYQIVASDPFAAPRPDAPLDPRFVPTLARALAKNPNERFPSCAAFIYELRRAAGFEPGASGPATVLYAPTPFATPPPPQRRKSSPLIPILAVVAVLLCIAGGGYWLYHHRQAPGGPGGTVKPEVPLIKAIAEGRLDDARGFLAKGVDVNEANADGTTALMQAAEGSAYIPNNAPAVAMVLEKNPKIEAQDNHGRTALYRAAAEGKDEAMRLLLAHKADPNHKGTDGSTALLAATTYGRLPAVKLLLASGAGVDIADAQANTPLMIAAEGTAYMPQNAPLVEALFAANPKIEAQDARGRTALYRAAAEGKTDAARLLLDKKANPNAQASDGSSPLFVAVEYGRLPTVQLLLERGAQIELADSGGNTPLLIAAEGNAYMPNNVPLVTALLGAQAKVEAQDSRGRTPLYRAAAEDKQDAMRLLIEKKANPNSKASDGSTPLLAAVTGGKLGAATLLLDHGSDPNLADASLNTPLMIAAEGNPYIKSSADFISLLLAHGAKTNLTDSQGRTALARATASKNEPAIDLLKNK